MGNWRRHCDCLYCGSLHIGGIVLFCVVIIAGLIYANTGNRFKKQS